MLTIPQHKTQVDIAVEKFGTVEALFDAALLNNAGITDDLVPGNSWNMPAKVYEIVPAIIPVPVQQPLLQILKKHQSLADYVTQHAGTVSSLFITAKLNALSITDEVPEGSILKILGENFKVIKFYQSSGYDIVSEKKASEVKPGGIGYMQIGNDFKVS
jgi:hypothetical protein